MTTFVEEQRQGGDRRALPGRDYLAADTCVNLYGPPPAVAETLRAVPGRDLLMHPYESDAVFAESYAAFLGVPGEHLVAGRGITEFIRALADLLPAGDTAVLTPDYTDTIRWFGHHHGPPPGQPETPDARLDRLDQALAAHRYVILSNPNNPTGIYLHRDRLSELCRRHPDSVLIVDEAYIDFVAGDDMSMVRCGRPNLVVLRSPNKPFGIAGVRTGALYTRDDELRAKLVRRKLNWSLSHLDVVAAVAALGSTDWLHTHRARLLADTMVVQNALTARFDTVVTDVPVHFRFVGLADPVAAHRTLLDHGVATRLFRAGEPGRLPGLRITTPTRSRLPQLLDAFDRLDGHR